MLYAVLLNLQTEHHQTRAIICPVSEGLLTNQNVTITVHTNHFIKKIVPLKLIDLERRLGTRANRITHNITKAYFPPYQNPGGSGWGIMICE